MGSRDTKIVLLGKTGAGKSSAGNTIFGEDDVFKSASGPNSTTYKCQTETRTIDGKEITLIDTAGFFDTGVPEDELRPEIVRCITECAPGPHGFLIVLKVEKITVLEEETITKIQSYFTDEVYKYATVLFTHGYQLKGQTIEEFVAQSEVLSELVQKCGGRCHVIDNEFWNSDQQDENKSNRFQVRELLSTIDKMVEENGGRCYTNEVLQAVDEAIQAERNTIMKQSKGEMSEEEINRQAKERVSDQILIKCAGIATGALVGALLGVVVMGGIVLALVNPIIGILQLKKLITPKIVAAVVPAVEPVAAGVPAVAAGASGLVIAVGVVFGTAALAGAVAGGMAGADAAEGAKTPGEAAAKAAKATCDQAIAVYDNIVNLINKVSGGK